MWLSLLCCLFALLLTSSVQAEHSPEKIKEFQRRFQEGVTLVTSGKFAEGRKIFDGILAEEPNARGSLLWAGIASNNLFEFDKAQKYLERFIAIQPDDPRGLMGMIICLQSSGKTEGIQKLIDRVKAMKANGEAAVILAPMERFGRELIRLENGGILASEEYFHNDPSRPVFIFAELGADLHTTREFQLVRASELASDVIRKKDSKLKDANLYIFQEVPFKDDVPQAPKIYQVITEIPSYATLRTWVLDARKKPPTPLNIKPTTSQTPAAPSPQ